MSHKRPERSRARTLAHGTGLDHSDLVKKKNVDYRFLTADALRGTARHAHRKEETARFARAFVRGSRFGRQPRRSCGGAVFECPRSLAVRSVLPVTFSRASSGADFLAVLRFDDVSVHLSNASVLHTPAQLEDVDRRCLGAKRAGLDVCAFTPGASMHQDGCGAATVGRRLTATPTIGATARGSEGY